MKRPSLPNACSERGASMGRKNTIEEPDEAIRFHLYQMPMSSCGCYDSGGAYWGSGSAKTGRMYHAYGEGPKFVNEMFIRATCRDDAKRQVKERFKNASFYR